MCAEDKTDRVPGSVLNISHIQARQEQSGDPVVSTCNIH